MVFMSQKVLPCIKRQKTTFRHCIPFLHLLHGKCFMVYEMNLFYVVREKDG